MFSHDRKRSQKQAEEARMEDEEKEALLQEQLQAKRQKEHELELYQRNQLLKIQKGGVIYYALFRAYNISATILELTRNSLGFAIHVIPPVHAFVSGVFSFLEIIEALFISREERQRRVVRVLNSVAGTALTIAGTVLFFNPATAPLATVFACIAMGIGTCKEGYLWYKANKDVKAADARYKEAKTVQQEAVSSYVKEHCRHELNRLHQLDSQIRNIEISPTTPSAQTRSLLVELKLQKQTLQKQINFQINSQQDLYKLRRDTNLLKKELNNARAVRDNQRKEFYLNAVSFVGIAALTAATVLISLAVVSNPISLTIIGMSFIAYATVRGLFHYFGGNKDKKNRVVSATPNANNIDTKNLNDTIHIIRKLSIEKRPNVERSRISEIAAEENSLLEEKYPNIELSERSSDADADAPLHLPKLDKPF